MKYGAKVDAADPWEDVLAYLRRSHVQMEPLYALERDGKLDGPDGESLIVGQMNDAASTLSALIWAAYTSAEPTDKQVESWARYDASEPRAGAGATQPSTQPAATK